MEIRRKLFVSLVIACVLIAGAIVTNRFSCRAEEVEEKVAVPAEGKEDPAGAGKEGLEVEEVEVSEEESLKKEYEFSDLSNWNLTVSAWEELAEKDYEGVFAYARKCLEVYEDKARQTAAEMRRFAGLGHEDDYAVVNDVATCHYIMGEAYMKQGKFDEAIKEFTMVIDEYPYAQCWDPKGWFWKVAEVSKKNIEKISAQGGSAYGGKRMR